MTKFIRKKKFFLNCFLILVLLLVIALNLTDRASAGMGVAPSKIELTLNRGQSQRVEMAVGNNTSTPLKVTFSTWDFARDEKGIPYPIGPEDVKTFRGCGRWVSFDSKTITVEPGQAGKQIFTVKVPEEADFGTHYTYVKVFGAPSSKKKGVTVNYQINALLLVTVGQEGSPVPVLKRSASLKGFAVKRFNFTNPVSFRAEVKNKGNVHLNLTGKIQIKKGKLTLETVSVKESTLLPASTFPVIKAWKDPPLFGKFRAKFVGRAGLDQPLRAEKTFWVISWKLIVGFILALIFLTISLFLFRRKFKLVRR